MVGVRERTQWPLVLVVEDDAKARAQRVKKLEKRGCRAEGASSLDEALALLDDAPPDLVLTDINLAGIDGSPNRDGVELARIVRARYEETVPIAAYSFAYRDADLAPSERGVFDLSVTKGSLSPRQVNRFFDDCAALAQVHFATTKGVNQLALERLHDRHPYYRPYATDRRRGPADDDAVVEQFVHDSGYDLAVVTPADSAQYREPFAVLVRDSADGLIVRVWGQRSLYSSGRNWSEALEELASLMAELGEDLRNMPVGVRPSPEAASLRSFVDEHLAEPQ